MMTVKATRMSAYMMVLAILIEIMLMLMMLMPSPLLTTIMSDTGWGVGQAGQLISIISLVMGIFLFISSPIIDKLGVKKTTVLAMFIGFIGGIIPFWAGDNYALHYFGRILVGVCYGLTMNVPALIVATWFPMKLQPAMHGVRVCLSYAGMALAYYMVMPIFHATNNHWQNTFGIIGVVCGVIAALYWITGKEKPGPEQIVPMTPEEEKQALETKARLEREKHDVSAQAPGLIQAMKSKIIWILTIAMICEIWCFTAVNTYMPTFLEYERGYSAEEASSMTGIFTIVGIVWGLFSGIVCSLIGRRKPFSWPHFLIGFAGIIVIVFASGGGLVAFGCVLFGFCVSGWSIVFSQVPADVPWTNTKFYAGSLGLIIGAAYVTSYFMPNVVDSLYAAGTGMPLGTIYIIFAILLVIGSIPLIFMPETGPKGKAKTRLPNPKANA